MSTIVTNSATQSITSTSTSRKVLTGHKLQEKINSLHELYLPMDLNVAFLKNKLKAIKKLMFILHHTTKKELQNVDYSELLLCSLTTLYFFAMQLKITKLTSKHCTCYTQRRFHKAERSFQKTLSYLEPEQCETTVKIAVSFFSAIELWPYESFVVQVFDVILYYSAGKMTLFNVLLNNIHHMIFKDIKSARHRMRVLYNLLKSNNWIIDKTKLLPFVTRLLDLFANSMAKAESKHSAYRFLRKGFEVCLRRIFERAENSHRLTIVTTMLNWFSMINMQDDDVLEFSLLLENAASLYKVGLYNDSFSEGLIDHILKYLVGSMNAIHSLVGCRLLLRFFDRNNNAPELSVPTLYYKFSQVRLIIGNYDGGDKIFLSHYREKLHDYFLMAFRRHCHSTLNLNALFTVICVIVLEVPCGLSAAAAACLVMSVQDVAINGENLSATSRYWLHAIVISVMSLICWVHKAPVLYGYVIQIIARRAKDAPELNPPLMREYDLSHRHVTWNKPSLFFEDWELRYGLWKHFHNTHQTLKLPHLNKNVPPTFD